MVTTDKWIIKGIETKETVSIIECTVYWVRHLNDKIYEGDNTFLLTEEPYCLKFDCLVNKLEELNTNLL